MSPAPPYYRKPFDPEDPDQEQQGPPPVPPMRFNPPVPDGNIPNDAAPAMPDSAPPPVRTPSPAAPVGPPVATAKAPSNIPPTFKQRMLGGGPAPTSIMTPGINGAPPPVGGAPGALTLPTPPPVRQPGLLQKLGSAGLGFAAGYTNAAGRSHIDPQTLAAAKEGILHPGQAQKQAEYEQQMERVKAQAGMAKTQADIGKTTAETGHANAQTALTNAQIAEGKDRYMKVGDGIFDKQTGAWKTQPTSKVSQIQLSPDWSKKHAPMLQPDENGEYWIPSGAADTVLKQTSTPEVKTLEEAAARVLSDSTIPADQKQVRLKEIAVAHTLLHPATPVHDFQTDDKGNVTMVIADPSNPAGMQKIPVGKVGKSKTEPPAPIVLSPEAIKQGADLYRTTGQLPALGMGSSGATARGQIMNEAGRSGGNIADNKADYKAQTGSLSGLQKQYDNVMAFERTASSNLDVANELSKQVDRTGSPIINRWILAAKGQIQGDPDTRKFEAAVQTAANEYAKVVTNNGASGSVTDSARREYERILNSADSPQAFDAIVQLMKREMGNRRTGFEDQLKEIHSRGNTQPPAPSTHKIGDVVNIGGKSVKITAVHPDGTFDGDEVRR